MTVPTLVVTTSWPYSCSTQDLTAAAAACIAVRDPQSLSPTVHSLSNLWCVVSVCEPLRIVEESFFGAVNAHAVSECFSCNATPLRTATPSSLVSLTKPLPSLAGPSPFDFWMEIDTAPVGFDPPPNVPTLQHIASPSKGPTLFVICCLFPGVLPPFTHSIRTAINTTPVSFPIWDFNCSLVYLLDIGIAYRLVTPSRSLMSCPCFISFSLSTPSIGLMENTVVSVNKG